MKVYKNFWILQLCFAFTLSLVLSLLLTTVKSHSHQAQKLTQETLYSLTDWLTGEKEAALYADPSGVMRLKKFNEKLHEIAEPITYLEVIGQPVYVDLSTVDNIPESCVEGYLYDHLWPDATLEVDGRQVSYRPVRAYHLSEDAMTYFQIEVSKGRSFKTADFTIDETQTVPVLLGEAYGETFKIGDRFKVEIINQYYDIEVIGFLESSAHLYKGAGPYAEDLSTALIFPSFDLEGNFKRGVLYTKYLQKNNGLFASTLEAATVQTEVDRIARPLSLEGLYVLEGVRKFDLSTFYIGFETLMFIFALLLLLSYVFSIVGMAFSIVQYLEDRKYILGLQILCGASTHALFKEIRNYFLKRVLAIGATFLSFAALLLKSTLATTAVFTLLASVVIAYIAIEFITRKKLVLSDYLKGDTL